jgi:hypothetical protein
MPSKSPVSASRKMPELGMPAFLPALRSKHDGGNDDDVGRVDGADTPLHADGQLTGELQRAGLKSHDLDPKGRPVEGCVAEPGQHAEGVHHVEDASQCRDRGLGDGNDADLERLRCGRGGMAWHIGSLAARAKD